MPETAMLYGYILSPRTEASHTAAAIQALPMQDAWPPLTPSLFAAPRLDAERAGMIFGFVLGHARLFPETSAWGLWRAKFEALLRAVVWTEARARLELGHRKAYQCTWYAALPRLLDGSPVPVPIEEWLP